jgi:transposase
MPSSSSGIPWRDLPNRFGHWDNVFQRFNRWCKKGVFSRLFEVFRDPDLEVLMLDSTVIRAHHWSRESSIFLQLMAMRRPRECNINQPPMSLS